MILDSPNPIIKELLKERDLTQEEAAKLLGLSYPYFNQIARGIRVPSKAIQQRIAEFYGVDVGELFKDD